MEIDLHVHSTASDGTDAPGEVIALAAAAGLDAVALTDHDTTAGWAEAAEAARRVGVILLPGAELSCHVGGTGVHVLAYLFDPRHPALLAQIERTRADRTQRARRMVRAIARDYPLTWDDVLEQVEDGATVGRPHIADAMVAKGLAASRDEAFATVLHNRSPYYLPHYAQDARRALGLIRAAGGVAVLAHPWAGRLSRRVGPEVIADLASAGLAGIEVDHPDQAEADRERLRALAGDLGLLVTGSSDYHGAGKSTPLGACTTAPEVFEAIVAAGHGSAVVRP